LSLTEPTQVEQLIEASANDGAAPTRVLVVTADVLGERMAGPAIRAWEMANALSRVTEVRLISTARSTVASDKFSVGEALTATTLKAHVDWAQVLVFQGHLLASHPWIKKTPTILVADLYDPMHLEQLEQGRELTAKQREAGVAGTVDLLNEQILRADFMLCASEKQRDFWLGQLAAMGRINPATYDDDESLRSLLTVVPFGVEDRTPVQVRHGIKGVVPGIAPSDKVVIWGGGIYNWFDPVTLIRAINSLSQRHDNVRLFFLGVKHPNPDVPAMSMALRARDLAEELGLLDRVVFFNEGWVPYESRADYLLDADVGVSTHLEHLETAFSFRTRILDYLWTSLPIVSTEGDTFAQLIEANDLGITVPPEDAAALELALESLLFDEERHSATARRVNEFGLSMRWEDVLTPIIDFCQNPRVAPDRYAPMELPPMIHIRQLERRVKGLEESTSWRVTRPIRWVVDKLRLQRLHRLFH
jgi:glycosyltransferase involved in cell wall biosynthesis